MRPGSSTRKDGQPSVSVERLFGSGKPWVQTRCSRRSKRARLVDMACVLCGSEDDPTDEDVIPRWLLHALNVEPGSTVSVAEEAGDSREVGKLRHFQVTLDKGLCRTCNNARLGGLEQLVQPILEPMAVQGERITLGLARQRLLAAWAIKTVYLLELASRQRYPGTRLTDGYLPSSSEIGWLLAELERGAVKAIKPPPRSMVWLALGTAGKGVRRWTAPPYCTMQLLRHPCRRQKVARSSVSSAR